MVSEGGIVAITLDIALPDRAGLRLIDELRQNPETEHIPIIIVSSKGQRGKSKPSVGAIRIVDWLEKPIDSQRFKRGVERAISGNRRPRILHVEDDEDHRQIVSQLIDGFGKIDTAKRCGEARKLLKATSYDLVILDLLLPDASGESLLPLIYAKGETAPPVLIFSVKEAPQSILASTAGALVKSKVSNEALKLQIKQLLTGACVREDITLFANQRASGL
jgi:DNA-binding response OmpR family regulator